MTWTISAFADEAGPTIDEQIAALTKAGLHHIDPRSVDGVSIVELEPRHAEEVRKKLDAAGIAVNMFGSPIGKLDLADDFETDLNRLRHLGKMKEIFDCSAVRMFSYYNAQAGKSHAEWQRASIDRLKRLIDEADRLGLVLFHENESKIFGDRCDDVLAIAELRDGQRFKLIYDFANYMRTGESNWDIWRKLRDKTDAIHFKDQRKTLEHVPMGEGDTDARAILEDAAKMGWEGPCTLEPHLNKSAAVLATNPEGEENETFADLGPAGSFHVAAERAIELVKSLGVNVR